MSIIYKQKGNGYAGAHVTGAESFDFSANTANGGLAAVTDETIHSMTIAEVIASVANGVYFIMSRGGDVVFNIMDSGHYNFQEAGFKIETGAQETANCSFTKVGTGPASLHVKFHKRASRPDNLV